MKDPEITTESVEETWQKAAEFTEEILARLEAEKDHKAEEKAALVCLWGDLGSGKTTFTQGIAKALGVKETVNSPTFLVMKKYPLSGKNKGLNLYHFDLYRIHGAQEILDLGWKEIVADRNNLVVVEWPEKIAEILPSWRIDLEFKLVSENARRIVFHLM